MKLGLSLNVFVSVRLTDQTPEAVQAFENVVRESPEIMECYLVTGEYDYILNVRAADVTARSEEHTSELQSLMRISYAVFCLKTTIHKNRAPTTTSTHTNHT